ncbi:MAG: hypothetical protein AB7O78_09095 [Thermoleophilia bacterium]
MEGLGIRGTVVHVGTAGGIGTARFDAGTAIVIAQRGGPLSVGDRVTVVGRRGGARVVEVGRRRPRRRLRPASYRTSWRLDTRSVTFRS